MLISFNTLNTSAGFDDFFFVASGSTVIGIISYTFTPTSTSNVGIIVNGATARLKLSQSGSSLIDTQACSYTASYPIFAFPCIAPVIGSAQIVFGTQFEVAASFAANASGLDFGPLAATAKLTYSITAANGTPLPWRRSRWRQFLSLPLCGRF